MTASPEVSRPEWAPTSLAQNLAAVKDGIWFSKDREPISYAEDGNVDCYQVEDESFWFSHRNACLVATLRRIPPAGLLYDIGGGNGFVSRAMIEAGFPSVLVEPGEAGARNARKRGVADIICATLSAAQFRSGVLPAAGLFDVLEHIEDAPAFLRELHRCLTPKGRLYATVPAYSWLWSDDDVVAGHFRRYTQGQFQRELKSAGFQPIFSSYFFSLLPLPLLVMRSMPSFFGRRALRRKNYAKLHRHRSGVLMDAVCSAELKRIARGRTLPFGSSCLIVAEKC